MSLGFVIHCAIFTVTLSRTDGYVEDTKKRRSEAAGMVHRHRPTGGSQEVEELQIQTARDPSAACICSSPTSWRAKRVAVDGSSH